MTQPETFRDLLAARHAPQPHSPAVQPSPVMGGGVGSSYGRAALAGELAELAVTPEGQRNQRLNLAGFKCATLVAAGHLPQQETRDQLRTVALSIGLTPGEVEKTLHSSIDAGLAHPRVVADLASTDAPTLPTLEDAGEDPEELLKRFPRIDFAALWDQADDQEWIVEPLLPARRLVALFSPPKIGKSLLMLDLAVQVSQGGSVLGAPGGDPKRVLYVDFENDPKGDVITRLKHMGHKPADLDNLVYLSFPQFPFFDTVMGGLVLMEVVKAYGADVVVIDTISRAVGGDENDNDTWLAFYRHTGVRLKDAGIACIRLDHTGKDHSKGMRGGSAKYGDVDVVWQMSQVTDDTLRLECVANRLPIPERYLKITRQADPLLRHVVDTRSERIIRQPVVSELIAVADAAGMPYEGRGSGRYTLGLLLKEQGLEGRYTQQQQKDALAERKAQHDAAQLRFDPEDD